MESGESRAVEGAVLALADSSVASGVCERLIADAARAGAKTIHLEPLNEIAQVRYRIDGVLHEWANLSHNALATLVAHFKHRANLLPDEKRWPQEGQFSIKFDNKTSYKVSLSTLPLAQGEKAVLKLVNAGQAVPDLSAIGVWGATQTKLRRMLAAHQGLVVVSGAHQAEVESVIHSLAELLNDTSKSVLGVGTTPRTRAIHHLRRSRTGQLDMVQGLRAALRSDTNTVVLGELHSRHEINAAIDAAHQGKLLVASFHAPTMAHTFAHLQAMAEEPFTLAHSLTGVLHQRMVRRLCDHCKVPARPAAEVLRSLTGNSRITIGTLQKFIEQTKKHSPSLRHIQLFAASEKGCARCRYSGFRGQIGLFELVPITPKIRRSLASHSDPVAILHQAVKEGMMPLVIDGFVKALCGITTLEEVTNAKIRRK